MSTELLPSHVAGLMQNHMENITAMKLTGMKLAGMDFQNINVWVFFLSFERVIHFFVIESLLLLLFKVFSAQTSQV